MSRSVDARRAADERVIGRLLILVTYLAVGLLVAGVIAMIVAGISPTDPAPTSDPAAILAAILALRPEGILWLGLAVVIATPILRVIAAALAYARQAEWRMLAISITILVVIAVGVATSLLTET
ncbi:MAG: DUF1634 domain-containing protein [Candidatus Limnocylindrales bacterium]